LNAEINSSVTNEAGKLSRFDVNGDPYAFLSEVNTKVSKSGDTMTGELVVNDGRKLSLTSGSIYHIAPSGGWSLGEILRNSQNNDNLA
jgi:hypothetical protein